MIKKDAFQNLKGRRVYQFYLDEETGEITDITSRDDYVQVIRCKNCKRFERYTTAPKKYQHDGFCQWWARDTYLDYWCCGAERKE